MQEEFKDKLYDIYKKCGKYYLPKDEYITIVNEVGNATENAYEPECGPNFLSLQLGSSQRIHKTILQTNWRTIWS